MKIPKSWILSRLGDVCTEPQYGYTTRAKAQGNIKLLRTTDITSGKINWDDVPYCEEDPSDINKYLLHDNDVVISRAGSVGYNYRIINPHKAVFASYLIRFKPLINPSYLDYFLMSDLYWSHIKEKSIGIALANVNASKLKEILFPLPPLEEQKRISKKIEELFAQVDEGIKRLKEIQEQIKQYRQAVLRDAFTGKLTKTWRKDRKISNTDLEKYTNGTTELSIDLPTDWILSTVYKISEKIHYGYTASSSKKQTNTKLLRITDIQDNTVDWVTVPYCTIDSDDLKKYQLKKGDLVFARTGATVGKSFLIEGTIPQAVFASYLIRIIPKNDFVPKYIYMFFQSELYWSQIRKGQKGIGQPNVNAQILGQLNIPITNKDEQLEILKEIDKEFSVANAVDASLEVSFKEAERLKQSILKAAFEGKLVPQDPNDEPVEKLLERIRAEKQFQRMVPSTRIKSKRKQL